MKNTRVVLADDHASVRSGVRKILQRAAGIEVVGEARNGLEALELVNRLSPDVLLLDMEMPLLSGVDVARKLYSEKSPVHILALSAYDDKQYIRESLANGAAGYLTKDEMPEVIVDAIHSVARGERGWFSQRAAAQLGSLRPKDNDLKS